MIGQLFLPFTHIFFAKLFFLFGKDFLGFFSFFFLCGGDFFFGYNSPRGQQPPQAIGEVYVVFGFNIK